VSVFQLSQTGCAAAGTTTSDDQAQDDNSCDVANEDDSNDDSFRAKQDDLFVAIPKNLLSHPHASQYCLTSISKGDRINLELSCTPDRAPPLSYSA
jgi:hypothetical protein